MLVNVLFRPFQSNQLVYGILQFLSRTRDVVIVRHLCIYIASFACYEWAMNAAPGKRSQCPRRLLVPITYTSNAPKPRGRVRAKSVSGKFTDGSPEAPTVVSSVASPSVPKYCNGFEAVEQEIILEGFQIYAVEKWCVSFRAFDFVPHSEQLQDHTKNCTSHLTHCILRRSQG